MAATVESIEISRRPEDVFTYVLEPLCYGEWDDSVVSAHREDPSPLAVGSKITVLHRMGPWKVPTTEEVIEFKPPAAVHQSGCQRASGRRREMHSRAAKRRPAVAPDDRARDRGPRPGQAACPLCPLPRTEGCPETTQEIEGDPRRGA